MTPAQLLEAPKGKYINLGRVAGSGALEARKEASGRVQFFWRYKHQKTAHRAPIGAFDPKAHHLTIEPTPNGFSIQAALREAESMARQHEANIDFGGYPALAKINAAANQVLLVKAPEVVAPDGSLSQLCDDYVAYLAANGKDSSDAGSCFRLHVKLAFPELAAKPANRIEDEDIAAMMRKLYDAGKQRQCNKLRSHLHAAYELARTARTSARVPVKFKEYKVRENPAHATKPEIQDSGNVDKNPMTEAELREYWRRIQKHPNKRASLMLQLHLLVGGQRMAQFCDLKTADIHGDYFELIDGKGKPGYPARRHAVALTPRCIELLQQIANMNSLDGRGRTIKKPTREYAFSSNGGKTPIHPDTLCDWATELMDGHVRDFTLKRVRSSMASLMKKALVPKIVRADIQSHGVEGVMSRHYEAEHLLDEKRWCLEMIQEYLEQKSGPPKRWPTDSKILTQDAD